MTRKRKGRKAKFRRRKGALERLQAKWDNIPQEPPPAVQQQRNKLEELVGEEELRRIL